MSVAELGGDPVSTQDGASFVVDLGAARLGPGGAIWSLPHGGDLDANLVRLDPGTTIGSHINNEVDVLLFIQSGTGELSINDEISHLGADHLGLIPKGSRRAIIAGDSGITYLSVHRRRGPLEIARRDQRAL